MRAAAVGELLYKQQEWQLRKVQSLELREGNYSVVRVSIDCIPQNLPGLEYTLTVDQQLSSFLTPIAYMEKGVLRRFDVRGPGGEPLPALGRIAHADVMRDVLKHELRDALAPGVNLSMLEPALNTILENDIQKAAEVSKDLTESGRDGDGGPILLQQEKLSTFQQDLLLSLAHNWVLFVLLPPEYAYHRVVLKYSHHALQEVPDNTLIMRWIGAAGLRPLPLAFDLSNPTGAASHHLEVSVPADLTCSLLRMPTSDGGQGTAEIGSDMTTDSAEDGVVHAVSSYRVDPGEPARVEFRVPWRGTRATAWVVAVTTFLILYLGLVLPGAPVALRGTTDGAAALLLGIPAVAVAFAASRRESIVESVLLGPLRVCILTCALLLLACAASIVGSLREPFFTALWSAGAAWTGLLTFVLCFNERNTIERILFPVTALGAIAVWGWTIWPW